MVALHLRGQVRRRRVLHVVELPVDYVLRLPLRARDDPHPYPVDLPGRDPRDVEAAPAPQHELAIRSDARDLVGADSRRGPLRLVLERSVRRHEPGKDRGERVGEVGIGGRQLDIDRTGRVVRRDPTDVAAGLPALRIRLRAGDPEEERAGGRLHRKDALDGVLEVRGLDRATVGKAKPFPQPEAVCLAVGRDLRPFSCEARDQCRLPCPRRAGT